MSICFWGMQKILAAFDSTLAGKQIAYLGGDPLLFPSLRFALNGIYFDKTARWQAIELAFNDAKNAIGDVAVISEL